MPPVSHFLLLALIGVPIGAAQAQSSYFDDGTRCAASSARKERVHVFNGAAATFVDIYLAPNPAAFTACMAAAGHPPPRVDAGQYTTVARACLKQARGAPDRDTAYAECIYRSGIVVEALPEDEAK